MNNSMEKISKILDSNSKSEKIKIMESLVNESNDKIITKIISRLDDPDIEVRGEAFSCLVLNENDISEILIKNLNSESKNIRAFAALVLANRKNENSIPSIIKLTKDTSSLVRACALGALGFLKANEASNVIHSCFFDSSLEVKKSALKAAIDIGDKLPPDEVQAFAKENDSEIEKLLVLAAKK